MTAACPHTGPADVLGARTVRLQEINPKGSAISPGVAKLEQVSESSSFSFWRSGWGPGSAFLTHFQVWRWGHKQMGWPISLFLHCCPTQAAGQEDWPAKTASWSLCASCKDVTRHTTGFFMCFLYGCCHRRQSQWLFSTQVSFWR